MKLIFLDIDGVLNHSGSPNWRENTMMDADPNSIEILNKVVEETGAEIVLSSMHRQYPERLEKLHKLGFKFRGMTPSLYQYRHLEIKQWISENLGESTRERLRFAVLDDLTEADTGDGNFFQTYPRGGGLTHEIADRVIKHLNGE